MAVILSNLKLLTSITTRNITEAVHLSVSSPYWSTILLNFSSVAHSHAHLASALLHSFVHFALCPNSLPHTLSVAIPCYQVPPPSLILAPFHSLAHFAISSTSLPHTHPFTYSSYCQSLPYSHTHLFTLPSAPPPSLTHFRSISLPSVTPPSFTPTPFHLLTLESAPPPSLSHLFANLAIDTPLLTLLPSACMMVSVGRTRAE